ncbi:MAG: DNA-3-methyladenine glycosylase [Anaerolineaceae bacterium]
MKSRILERDFYLQPVVDVARALIGKSLVHQIGDRTVTGIILETEAYDGEQDQACHARSGKTKRNTAMYGPAGHAYIYFTYGMHWLFNCVTGCEGYPAAVLIRSIHPVGGLEIIAHNRNGIKPDVWCNGPAKLTCALAIDGTLNGCDLCQKTSVLRVEEGITISEAFIQTTPRIGIGYAGEPWKSKPWRFTAQLPPSKIDELIE